LCVWCLAIQCKVDKLARDKKFKTNHNSLLLLRKCWLKNLENKNADFVVYDSSVHLVLRPCAYQQNQNRMTPICGSLTFITAEFERQVSVQSIQHNRVR